MLMDKEKLLMNKCENCGKEPDETYASECSLCEECRKKAEIEQHQYDESKVQKPIVIKYRSICLINLLVCAVIALTQIPYLGAFLGDGGDDYFAFIRTCILIVHYAIHTPLLCLHFYLYNKHLKVLVLSIIAHIAIIVWIYPISVFF